MVSKYKGRCSNVTAFFYPRKQQERVPGDNLSYFIITMKTQL